MKRVNNRRKHPQRRTNVSGGMFEASLNSRSLVACPMVFRLLTDDRRWPICDNRAWGE